MSLTDEQASGAFLIGLAALAIFNFWWPGILLVGGATLLARQRYSRLGWGLLALGGVFWLRRLLVAWDMPALFPLLLVAAGVALVLGVDLRRWFNPPGS